MAHGPARNLPFEPQMDPLDSALHLPLDPTGIGKPWRQVEQLASWLVHCLPTSKAGDCLPQGFNGDPTFHKRLHAYQSLTQKNNQLVN